jgi:hypothetical protein
MVRSGHTAPKLDVFDLSGEISAARVVEIERIGCTATLRVIQGRTTHGRDLIVVESSTAEGEPRPIACRPMDDDERRAFARWRGESMGQHRTHRRGPSKPQWPLGGMAPRFSSDEIEAEFWTHWSFARVLEHGARLGTARTPHGTIERARTHSEAA